MGNVNLNHVGITKGCLENIRKLSYEIHKLEAKLEELNSRSIVASPVPGEVHGSGVSDKVASTIHHKLELEHELSEKRGQLRERLNFIEEISDEVMREIVLCQCVYKFTWREIAEKVGGNEDSVKKSYYRFMDNLENCPEMGQKNA